jgi:tRNA/tmRNA/rRNA uracil-C5-methylase (TrmA/RlmC/RlmD family)
VGSPKGTIGQSNGRHDREPERTSRTVGWEPSCAHQDDTGQSVVLDPFAGAGTTGMVALRHDRSFIGIELNPEYVRLARDRIIADSPLLNTHAEEAA